MSVSYQNDCDRTVVVNGQLIHFPVVPLKPVIDPAVTDDDGFQQLTVGVPSAAAALPVYAALSS